MTSRYYPFAQAKINKLRETAEKVGLKIHPGKTKIFKINTTKFFLFLIWEA